MTQFLLCASAHPPATIEGLRFAAIAPDQSFVVPVVAQMRCPYAPLWIGTPDDHFESVLTRTGEAIDTGHTFDDTPLGRIVSSLLGQVRALALFYASYPEDLPVASNTQELTLILEGQLRAPRPMGVELYVVWRALAGA